LFLGLLALAVVAGQWLNRFSLNHGGTDPAWMWFGGEPPGLQRERDRSGVAKAAVPPPKD
jgi:hypothetical protein